MQELHIKARMSKIIPSMSGRIRMNTTNKIIIAVKNKLISDKLGA